MANDNGLKMVWFLFVAMSLVAGYIAMENYKNMTALEEMSNTLNETTNGLYNCVIEYLEQRDEIIELKHNITKLESTRPYIVFVDHYILQNMTVTGKEFNDGIRDLLTHANNNEEDYITIQYSTFVYGDDFYEDE